LSGQEGIFYINKKCTDINKNTKHIIPVPGELLFALKTLSTSFVTPRVDAKVLGVKILDKWFNQVMELQETWRESFCP